MLRRPLVQSVLIVRDETDLDTMIANCESGGGIGAVIFDAVRGSDRVKYRNWVANSNIPAIGVQYLEGVRACFATRIIRNSRSIK